EQQKDAELADRRVVCAEDLVRFHQEQRRMMASHWKQQCQMKDERIRYLNLQLTEYTIDWQQLGVQRQTEASLSHEHYCLEDRHRHLLQTQRDLATETSRLEARLEEAKVEEVRLTDELRLAEASLDRASRQSCGMEAGLDAAEPRCVPRWKDLVQAPKSHRCIWRDELDVRETQLEKITAQLERTDSALKGAQVALASQRAKHQEMKTRHGDAESKLRESERLRVQSQRRCQELGRAEAAMLRLLEAVEAHGPNTPSGPSAPPLQTESSSSLPES
ncbi:RGLG2, partial [Symbiodinium pilosum]